MKNSTYYQYLVEALSKKNSGILEMGSGDDKVRKNTEAKMIKVFSKKMQKSMFRSGRGNVMAFTGKNYIILDKAKLKTMAVSVLDELNCGEVYQVATYAPLSSYISSMTLQEYKPKKHLIAFDNKVLDVSTMETFDHSEDLETDIYIPYDYDPKADCPKFKKFLAASTRDQSALAVLQEYVGAFFINRTEIKLEQMMFILGDGANGKGVFTAILNLALGGRRNTSTFSLYQLLKANNCEQNRSEANGKLANLCYDMSSENVSGGDFKTLISGEPITARELYGTPYQATEMPLILVSLNKMPATSDKSYGDKRRRMIVKFPFTPPKLDPYLITKLSEEISGVMNWMIEGRNRLLANKGEFTYSASMLADLEEDHIEGNSMLSFLREKRYFPKPSPFTESKKMTTKQVFAEYKNECVESGIKLTFVLRTISEELKRSGFKKMQVVCPETKKYVRGYEVHYVVEYTELKSHMEFLAQRNQNEELDFEPHNENPNNLPF